MSRRLAIPEVIGFLVISLVSVAPAAAGWWVVTLAPEASEVAFTLDTTLHVVHGKMLVTSGEIRFDPGTGEATGAIAVDARTAATGNGRRDRKMHEEILESARYPAIVFRARRVEGRVAEQGASEARLSGTMSLHGADHSMEIPLSVTVEGGRFKAEARFEVPYVEWGLEDPSFLVLRAAKTVAVTVRAEGRVAKADR